MAEPNLDERRTETVRVPYDVEVPTALVEAVTEALVRDHHMTFTGQFDRVERAHARWVASTAVAAVLAEYDLAERTRRIRADE